MESKRQKQVSELVKRHFSELMQYEATNICGRNVLTTVTGVKMSPDLTSARIYFSFLGTENKQEPLLMLREETVMLRQKLSQRIRKQVRIIPTIDFYLDEMVDEMYSVNSLIQRLDAEGQFGSAEDRENK
jgi:ribosome-binding factor A